MKREVNPMDTNRAMSWEMFIDAPMPMVTIFKTLDISHLMEIKKKGYKLNMLMCYCIAMAADEIPEFKLLPEGRKMMSYDQLGVNVIVKNNDGGINSCDIPFESDLDTFNMLYLELTNNVYQTCENYDIEDRMIVGTSSLVKYSVDGVINMYSGIFNNPFLAWGRYCMVEGKITLKVSYQFHHVQMDGIQACEFLEKLQNCVDTLM